MQSIWGARILLTCTAGCDDLTIDMTHRELTGGRPRYFGAKSFKSTAEFLVCLVRLRSPVALADKFAHRAIFFFCRPLVLIVLSA
jgi:hypothetical protein